MIEYNIANILGLNDILSIFDNQDSNIMNWLKKLKSGMKNLVEKNQVSYGNLLKRKMSSKKNLLMK